VTRVARERTSGPENEAQRRALAFLQLEGSALGAAAFPGPGDRVADFVIEHELGRGGAGVVYRARQLHLGRSVALKLIPHGPATLTDEYARRLERGRSLQSTATSASGHARRRELEEQVRSVLLRLSEAERETLLLRLFEGLSGRAAARRLGVDESTVSMRFKRALETCAVHLREHAP